MQQSAASHPSMSEPNTDVVEEIVVEGVTETKAAAEPMLEAAGEGGFDFSERYKEVVGKVNETLEKVDWSQMGLILKVAGIFLAVIIIQILIKGVLDTINLLPIIPGLLELLGLVVVGQWSWQNLTTSEKRSEVLGKIQALKKDYIG